MNPIGLTGSHFINPQSTGSAEMLPWEALSKKIGSFAKGVFKVISAPIKLLVYLTLIPITVIVSSGIGIARGIEAAYQAPKEKAKAFYTTAIKCALFGATFFFRPLLSSVGVNLKGGAPYTWRSQIENDLFVSRVPFKSEVSDIAVKLTKKDSKSVEQQDVKTAVESLFPDENNPTRKAILDQLEKQKGPFKGVVIDVTEREELTPVLTHGRPAETEDWNKAGILHINISSEDMKALNVNKNVDLAEFGNLCREKGLGVLVHCAKGIGRSAGVAITMMAIKKEQGLSPEATRPRTVSEAIEAYKKVRAYGLNEMQELAVYESKVQALINDLKENTNPKKEAIVNAFKMDQFKELKTLSKDAPHLQKAINEYEKAFNIVQKLLAKDPEKLAKFDTARSQKMGQ